MPDPSLTAAEYTTYRSLIFSIAYRMLGSVSEAEDIVQEAFLRLHNARQEGVNVESAKAYLAAIATRLSIDHLRSARVRRESYVGQWLPEPVVVQDSSLEQEAQLADSLSMAFLTILETLSPVERAVFLLREVFEYEYQEIANIVAKSEDNCRQIFTRAKRHIDAGKPRFEPSPEKRDEIAQRFFTACQNGKLEDLVDLLASDIAFHGDGGGKAFAALQPVVGRDRVGRLLLGIFAKGRAIGASLSLAHVNGQPGALAYDAEHRLVTVFALDIADGVIQAIRSVVNPDKLQHFGPVSDFAQHPVKAPPQ
jgi:RNA polymerase sigma-70 factor (ECF subfamily)